MAADVRTRDRSDQLAVATQPHARLRLLGAFELSRAGQPVILPAPAERLVAYLALQKGLSSRARVAGTLWLESTQDRALANLRSAVWRARACDGSLLEITSDRIRLADCVEVDAHDVAASSRRLIDGSTASYDHDLAPDVMTVELLPDWLDEWVVFERARLRQLFLHALEALTYRLSNLGQHAQAIEAGMSLVRREPLRESAHCALIEAHLAEGNRDEALRQHEAYRKIMRDELGLEPSRPLSQLLERILRL